MSTVSERLQDEAVEWGVKPAPQEVRRLGGGDFAVLWGNLSIGLLVAFTGALLVPALGFPVALLAIVVGSVLGCALLGLVGVAGAREGVPGMVLFRPLLGIRGSYLPTVANVVQLVGWTAFELWAMAVVASRVGGDLLGIRSYALWLVVVSVLCTALALGGPVLVVRRWMERFGVWVVAGVGVWITVALFANGGLAGFWSRPGAGGFPGFWQGVDLVIVMPISWLPLVADYSRFAKRGVSSFTGTFLGYFAGNVWFYALGALLVLAGGFAEPTPAGLAQAIASVAGGAAVLVALLVGETDQAFADIYSTAVSAQNLSPRIRQRPAVAVVAAVGFGIALALGDDPTRGLGAYESFLFLLGSVFVPVYGVFLADYFVRRRGGFVAEELFGGRESRYWFLGGFNPRTIAPWVAGFLVYHWCGALAPGWWMTGFARGVEAAGLPYPLFDGALGASLPSFVASFGLALLAGGFARRSVRPG
ncbi:MAG: cytosine permease [Actinobacteria bacterium]|nr:cytosine permease [Actinomycetota bacterium]